MKALHLHQIPGLLVNFVVNKPNGLCDLRRATSKLQQFGVCLQIMPCELWPAKGASYTAVTAFHWTISIRIDHQCEAPVKSQFERRNTQKFEFSAVEIKST